MAPATLLQSGLAGLGLVLHICGPQLHEPTARVETTLPGMGVGFGMKSPNGLPVLQCICPPLYSVRQSAYALAPYEWAGVWVGWSRSTMCAS